MLQGDLIYSKIRPALRKAVIATENCLCSADMYAIKSVDGQILERFMLYVLLARPFTDFAMDASQRVAMPKVNREALEAFRFVLPPAEEQCRIVDLLDLLTGGIDKLMEECRALITLLKERRSALITAAVTGQIDVRGS